MTSLAMKSWEPGDSDGARRRMETVSGTRDVARVKILGRGLNESEGIGWLSVGVSTVGGSYLQHQHV